MLEASKIGNASTVRNTACVLALLAMLFSLVSPALCAPKDCMPIQPAESTGNCQGMPMGNETGKTVPSTPMHCCDVSQYPVPATQTAMATAFDQQMVVVAVLELPVPLGQVPENLISEPIASSPPADLQALFCTLLI